MLSLVLLHQLRLCTLVHCVSSLTWVLSFRKQKLADSQQPRAYLEGATLEPTVEQRYKEVTDEIDGLYSEGITDYKSSTDQRELEETPQGHEDDEMVDGTSAERSIQMTNAHMKKVERLQVSGTLIVCVEIEANEANEANKANDVPTGTPDANSVFCSVSQVRMNVCGGDDDL